MRLGFVTSSFPRSPQDSAGIFVLEMARSLVALGHTVEVVVPQPATQAAWSEQPDWLGGIRVVEAPYLRPRAWQRLFFEEGAPEVLARHPAAALLTVPATLALYAAARSRVASWDALVSHWLVPSGLAAVQAAPAGLPHLAIAHSGDVQLLARLPGGAHLAAQVIASCTAVGCVCDALRAELLALVPGQSRAALAPKLITAPMGYDPQLGAIAATRRPSTSSTCTVLALGRLVPIKGLDVLLEAMAGENDLRLIVAGDGPLRSDLELHARRLRIDAEFTGQVSPSARGALLRAADVLVLPSRVLATSRHEGLPLSLLEAMASGLPAVASDTGGVSELIEPGVSGWLVPPGNVAALRHALHIAALSPRRRWQMGQAAATAVSPRSWDRLAPSYETLLRSPLVESDSGLDRTNAKSIVNVEL